MSLKVAINKLVADKYGVYGDCTQEWLLAARTLGIPVSVLSA